MNEKVPVIPLSRIYLGGNERGYIEQAILGGSLGGGGRFNITCENTIQEILGCHRVMLTSSCSSALHLALQALDLTKDSEVIVPSFAFASCASVMLSLGLRPIFADSIPDTLNVDANHVERLIGPRTGAILIIHYGGVACEMDDLTAISLQHGVPLVEDAAHALFGKYHGKALGSFGVFSAFSFDQQKNLTCGEGGALVVNDPARLKLAEVSYHRGTNRAQLLRGDSENYEWVGPGGNYALSELQAAFLLGQLDCAAVIQEKRREIWHSYANGLGLWAEENNVTLASFPTRSEPAYHIFYALFPSRSHRDAALVHLRARGIEAAFHYLPLHISPAGKKLGGYLGQCPVSEDVSQRLLRLPLSAALSIDEAKLVVNTLMTFRCG